jgi:hypothetical protein
MKNISDISFGENENTHFKFSNCFFPQNHAVYEIMWKNSLVADRTQMAT